ncbi:MAG: hypothetical protein V4734_03860 [Terriglobus sp.]
MARFTPNRLLFPCCSCFVSVIIFLHEDYQHINVAHPETLIYALGHWCGLLMLACIGWLLVEMALLLLSPVGMDHSMR